MSTKRKRAKGGNYSRREQRQMTLVVTLLFTLSVAALAMMAVVNRLPIGKRYTYTDASDMWILDGGEMQIAAPEVILFTEEPEETFSPTPSPTPTESPELTPEPAADAVWGDDVAPETDVEWESDMESEDDMGWESFQEPETDLESEASPETSTEPSAEPSPTSGFPLPEGA